MSVFYKELPGGLRIVTEEVSSVETVAVGVWCAVGSRHENLKDNGVAHMVEHMLFKGTPARSARQIAEQIENAGGHMNAYTSREITSYHIHLLKEDFRLGMDILADMIQHSNLPEEEVERERQVIIQEIGMTFDTPDDYVFDLYQEAAYPAQTLGAPILGNAEIIGAMQRVTLTDYIKTHYTRGNLVICVAGNIRHQEVEEAVQALFTDLPEGDKHRPSPASYAGGEKRLERDHEQAHIVLGFQSVSRHDPDFHAAGMLATLLGGGMSSRLFQEIREKRGLVYSVFAMNSAYSDDGQFEVYAGTGPDLLPELVPVLCDQLLESSAVIKAGELDRAKSQRRASLLMSRESMMSRADRQARTIIHHGAPFGLASELAAMDAVTAEDVRRAASRIFSGNPSLAALGPLDKLEPFEALKERLAA
jgi:predicted Zn-dependent peptidase